MRTKLAIIGCIAALACMTFAGAEVKVSITITGNVDEIIPILVQLKNMGVGAGGAAPSEDLTKLQVHSVTVAPAQGQPGGAVAGQPGPPEAAPAPRPALAGLVVSPPSAKPGQEVVVSVVVSDPDHRIDTVAAKIATPGGLSYDLYDKGDQGDQTAADNVWTRSIPIPPGTPVGTYEVAIAAFDPNGDPVMADKPDGTKAPLTVTASLTVTE